MSSRTNRAQPAVTARRVSLVVSRISGLLFLVLFVRTVLNDWAAFSDLGYVADDPMVWIYPLWFWVLWEERK